MCLKDWDQIPELCDQIHIEKQIKRKNRETISQTCIMFWGPNCILMSCPKFRTPCMLATAEPATQVNYNNAKNCATSQSQNMSRRQHVGFKKQKQNAHTRLN